jgi:DNA polymerase III sliding clamp (beta) subunit (PCNA family)
VTFSLNIMAREIASAIAACAQIVDHNSKIPILKTTRISVDGGFVTFMATNTDQTIMARAACEGAGTICIDVPSLDLKIKSLRPDKIVRIEGDDKIVTITQDRTKWKVPVLLDDWPMAVTKPVDGDHVAVGRDFVSALKQTIGLVNSAHPTPALTGVQVDDNRIRSTDAKRMRSVGISPVGFNFIMPLAIASKLLTLTPDGGALRVDGNRMSISTDFLTVISRLVPGPFPDLDKAIARFSDRLKSTATADANELLASLRRSGSIGQTGEKQNAFLNMQLRFRDDEVEIFARNLDGEEGTDFSRIQRNGIDADIGVVGNEVIDEIDSLDCDTVSIEYGDAETPIMISAVGRTSPSFRIVQARTFR